MHPDLASLSTLILLAHGLSTWAMFGLIWFVQVVHYPLFVYSRADFPSFESQHRSRTTMVVAPLMLTELFTAALLLFPSLRVDRFLSWSGIALLLVIWLSTHFLQVPMHNILSKQFQPSSHRRLVHTNWIRTAAWSLRGLLAGIMLWKLFR